MRYRARAGLLTSVASVAALALAGCDTGPSAQVPSLSGSGQAGPSSADSGTRPQPDALHAAAQCIRDHGVPAYQDPVVAPDGDVFTDQRSLQDYAKGDPTALDRLLTDCRAQLSQADFNPSSEPQATPALVQAGVRAAQCMRAHGLPDYRDPTPGTEFVPGHGFNLSADELPPGGKSSGVMEQATQACRDLLDQEIAASQLTNLAHG
ncbi:MAG TPA: hypothetical protein VFG87_17465 [Amycolatopsis sp.]|jgi:hypothetical protein|nr:hypothetical protein [Amycolatopsis sp.]